MNSFFHPMSERVNICDNSHLCAKLKSLKGGGRTWSSHFTGHRRATEVTTPPTTPDGFQALPSTGFPGQGCYPHSLTPVSQHHQELKAHTASREEHVTYLTLEKQTCWHSCLIPGARTLGKAFHCKQDAPPVDSTTGQKNPEHKPKSIS